MIASCRIRKPVLARGTACLLAILMCLLWMPAAKAKNAAVDQCKAPGMDRSQVLPEAMFGVRLPPFGEVCFLGRHVPLPGDVENSDIIRFELWHDGKRVYTLPKPFDGLWPPACDGIRAVAFPARGERRDIIVIGNCLGAHDEQAQPLVYRAQTDGFALDEDLSLALMGVDTVKQVELRMRQKSKHQSKH